MKPRRLSGRHVHRISFLLLSKKLLGLFIQHFQFRLLPSARRYRSLAWCAVLQFLFGPEKESAFCSTVSFHCMMCMMSHSIDRSFVPPVFNTRSSPRRYLRNGNCETTGFTGFFTHRTVCLGSSVRCLRKSSCIRRATETSTVSPHNLLIIRTVTRRIVPNRLIAAFLDLLLQQCVVPVLVLCVDMSAALATDLVVFSSSSWQFSNTKILTAGADAV